MGTNVERRTLQVGKGKHLLVITKDPHEREQLVFCLRTVGFDVIAVDTCDDAIDHTERLGVPHLILMNMSSAENSLFEKGRLLSRQGHVPIIVLSAIRDVAIVTQSIVEFADDYIRIPFDEAELLARVHRVLQRSTQPYSAKYHLRERIGEDFYIDFDRGDAMVDERPVLLTPIEVQIMRLLHEKHGQIVPYRLMTTSIWGINSDEQLNTLWVHIRRLRTKIEVDPRYPKRLLTVRGVGYYLSDKASDSNSFSLGEVADADLVPSHSVQTVAES